VRHPPQQRRENGERQPLPRLTVAGGREVDAAELTQVGDGGVAVQDLQREQAQRHQRRQQRRQQRVAPDVLLVAAELIEKLGDGKIGERFAAQTRQCGDSHPWPPVKGVVKQHHFRRRPLVARVALMRAAARSYELAEWRSVMSPF